MHTPALASLLVIVVALASVDVLTAGERARTPAEIELRRTEIAERLAVLADANAELERQLSRLQAIGAAPAQEKMSLEEARAQIADRAAAVLMERDALVAEAGELAGIVTRTPTGPSAPADPPGLRPAQVGGTGQVSAGTAFNPAITVIPDGLYYYDNTGGGDPRGFSLREVELAFSGAVDPYFDVWATFGIGDGEIEGEEVYVQTRRFLPGTQVRFGRFFSGIGYLNRQHRHQWDFVDAPLPYESLFGSNIGEVGVQLTWLPDIPVYAQLGVEALQGDNTSLSNQLAGEYPDLLDEVPGPRLFTGFLKISPDLGFSHALQAGVSAGRSRSHQEADPSGAIPEVFDGTAWFVATDWIWRYDSPSPYGKGDLTVQGEYIYRSTSLVPVSVAVTPGLDSERDGVYAQMVYGVGPRWTVGGRAEALGLRNRIETLAGTIDVDASTRYSGNVTFNPTEFSRFRAQYNRARVPERDEAIHQVYVQFQMSLGVHGAHQF